jgi:AcrR family transcriptional regulator
MPKVVDVDERRATLAAAAARVIARSGLGSATMRDVAAEAGLTTGAVTHYFADKRELMVCVFSESLEYRKRRSADRDIAPALDALIQSLCGALPLDDERRQHWMVTIAFCAEAAGDPELLALQQHEYRQFVTRVVARVESVDEVELESGADAVELAERLIACADGIAMQALFDRDGWPPTRQLTRLRELVCPLLGVSDERFDEASAAERRAVSSAGRRGSDRPS